jgi:formiminotetrahydrofolate cyclodeaminase
MARETTYATAGAGTIFYPDYGTGIVAAASISGALALHVLRAVLEVAARHEGLERVAGLMRRAEGEAERLEQLAQEDGLVYAMYLRASKQGRGEEQAALRRAIETPLAAARSAASGLDLCVETLGFLDGAIAADARGAAAQLAGTVRAILCTVDENLRTVTDDAFFCEAIAERQKLAERANYGADFARYL